MTTSEVTEVADIQPEVSSNQVEQEDTGQDAPLPSDESPPEQPISKAPEPITETPGPVTDTPKQSEDSEFLRQQIASRDQQLQQYQQQQQMAQVQQRASQLSEGLINQGIDESQARVIASQQVQSEQNILQLQQTHQTQMQNEQGKMNAALHYSNKYKVPAQELMGFDDPQTMESAAKDKAKVLDLERKLSELTKAGVPAQRFDSGQGGVPPTNIQTRRAYLRNKEGSLTEDEHAELGKFLKNR